MTDNKLTDEQIIKAWECCASVKVNSCGNCPFKELCFTDGNLHRYTLDIFNRQKAEIDILIRKNNTLKDEIAELKAEIERLRIQQSNLIADYKQIAINAMKKFAEKLKEKAYTERGFMTFSYDTIDNLLKEMDGDTE